MSNNVHFDFIQGIIENLPPSLLEEDMCDLLNNPQEFQRRLKVLLPSFRQTVRKKGVKFLTMDDCWDFLILKSDSYPEVGIAVSNYSGSCGKGLDLVVNAERPNIIFTSPWGCNNDWCWPLGDEEAVLLIGLTCQNNGVKFLILNKWREISHPFDKYGLALVEPFNQQEMLSIDKDRLVAAFSWLYLFDTLRGGSRKGLEIIFEER